MEFNIFTIVYECTDSTEIMNIIIVPNLQELTCFNFELTKCFNPFQK